MKLNRIFAMTLLTTLTALLSANTAHAQPTAHTEQAINSIELECRGKADRVTLWFTGENFFLVESQRRSV